MAYCCALQEQGLDTVDANKALGLPVDAREYYTGAQILRDLGVRNMRLLTNNPDKIYQLSQFGLAVEERVPIEITPTDYDGAYLATKRDRIGHQCAGLNHAFRWRLLTASLGNQKYWAINNLKQFHNEPY